MAEVELDWQLIGESPDWPDWPLIGASLLTCA